MMNFIRSADAYFFSVVCCNSFTFSINIYKQKLILIHFNKIANSFMYLLYYLLTLYLNSTIAVFFKPFLKKKLEPH